MGWFGGKSIRKLEEALGLLHSQVTVQWQNDITERRAETIVELLRELRSKNKGGEAAAVLERFRNPSWSSFALGNNPVQAMESLARGGWHPPDGRDAKWGELMARFDGALRGR